MTTQSVDHVQHKRTKEEQHAEKVEQMEAIHARANTENRSLTQEESSQWDELRNECIAIDGDIRRLQFLIENRSAGAAPVPGRDNTEIGLTEKEKKRFSLMKALRALSEPMNKQLQNEAAFERECSEEAAKRSGTKAKGIMVPTDIIMRDLNVTAPEQGGHTVATELLNFIDILRNRLVVEGLGATVLNNLKGDIQIPRQDGTTTGYWISQEGGAPNESTPAIGQVSFTPRTVGAFTDYTRQFLMQSSLSVENFVKSDLAAVLARAIDLAALYGTGASGQPKGIANITGINTLDFAGCNPTFAELVEMETKIASDNADAQSMAYAINAVMRGHAKTTEKFTGTGHTIWENGNAINGYSAKVSNQIPNSQAIFGNWASLILAMWGGLDLTADPYSQATSGTVRIIALQSMDCGVRHAESFCVGKPAASGG